jgi:hypothetical protein
MLLHRDSADYFYNPEDIADSTRTQASSTHDYKYEHGRRYHAYREGLYPLPNDDLNTEHEQIAHHMFGIMLQDKLYLAPIEKPKNVIDLGAGTGLCKSKILALCPLNHRAALPYSTSTFFLHPELLLTPFQGLSIWPRDTQTQRY